MRIGTGLALLGGAAMVGGGLLATGNDDDVATKNVGRGVLVAGTLLTAGAVLHSGNRPLGATIAAVGVTLLLTACGSDADTPHRSSDSPKHRKTSAEAWGEKADGVGCARLGIGCD